MSMRMTHAQQEKWAEVTTGKLPLNTPGIHPFKYGPIGEMKAQIILIEKGYDIYTPLNTSSVCDFVAEKDKKMFRVQSKYKTVYQPSPHARESSRRGTVRVDLRRNRRAYYYKDGRPCMRGFKEFYDLDYIHIFTVFIPNIDEVLFLRKQDLDYVTPRGTKPRSIQIRVFDIGRAYKSTRNSCVKPYTDYVNPAWLDGKEE